MASTTKRNVYKPEFKAKVALEAVRGRLTINEISQQFGVHPNQISKWKKQFLENLPQIFDNSTTTPAQADEELTINFINKSGNSKLSLIGSKKIFPIQLACAGSWSRQTIKRFRCFANVSF